MNPALSIPLLGYVVGIGGLIWLVFSHPQLAWLGQLPH